MFEICLLFIDKKKIDRTLRYTRSTDYAQYSDRALIEGCSETDRQRGRKKERERKRGEEKFTFEETKGVLVIHGGAKNDRGSSRQRKNEKKKRKDTIDHSFRLRLRESGRTGVLEAVAGKEIQTNV